MSYRITETTDRKNLGQVLETVALRDTLSLHSGAEFRVEHIAIDGDTLTLSNQNYIIIAIKE
jgi:hypothetical protein